MFRIGVVDLDTSHPVAWVPKINSYPDMKVVAVWDSGAVNPRSYVEEFAEKNGIETVVDSLPDMAPLVDAAIIHGVDWDLHVDKAIPFVEAKKPVLLDKPMVGKLRDIDRLIALHKKHPDVAIMGGSSLRFAREIASLKAQMKEFGEVSCAFASGPGDFFSYGIHTVEMFQGVLGVGVRCVQHLGSKGQSEFFGARYADGTMVTYQLSAPLHEWFLAISTPKGIKAVTVDPSRIYDAIIERFYEMLSKGDAPLPLEEFLL